MYVVATAQELRKITKGEGEIDISSSCPCTFYAQRKQIGSRRANAPRQEQQQVLHLGGEML